MDMDCNPPDHFQLSTPMIQLKSSDGEIFQVEGKVAQCFLLIKEMLDELGVEDNDVISIPQNAPKITGTILGKIIQWANHHKDDSTLADDDETEEKPTDDISSWDAEFLQVDQSTLFQIIRAANFLNIKGLLDVTCKKVAKMIKGMTPEEARQKLNIHNDFSPDEEEQIRKENAWCEGFSCEENNGKSVDGSLMDKNPAVAVKDMEIESGPVVEDCLRISVVVRKVLKHFSNPELLKLSTMNKLWNDEARCVLRKRGNLIARLESDSTHSWHQVLEAFGTDLQKMNTIPYSGIAMVINGSGHTVGSVALDLTLEVALAQLPLKRLSLFLYENWWMYKDFPAFLLVKKLLQDFSGDLVELTLYSGDHRHELFQRFIGDCSLPGLKVLKLEGSSYSASSESYTNYMRALVSRAQNLQELHTYGPINLMTNVLEGSEAVLVHDYVVKAPFGNISESVIDTLRLRRMEMKYTGSEFNYELFDGLAPMLLEASCLTTLQYMDMDAVLAVPLMCYGISLIRVEDLSININYCQMEDVEPQILGLVKGFDFTRIFPNCNRVTITSYVDEFEYSRGHLDTIIEEADAILEEQPLPDRAANIKELCLAESELSDEAVSFFAEMFPNIELLEIDADDEEEIAFGSIWKFKDLIDLKVRGSFIRNTANLDGVFCGIFPEEVADLRLKDDEYLERVNVVPVMPAITCLKNLKSLTLDRDVRHLEPHADDGTFMFSKVTGLIAFAKSPSLAISLQFSRSYGVVPGASHLEAFASVTVM